MEASLRTFAGQHPRRIAEEMGVSYSALQSILCRMDMPRDQRKDGFVDAYDPELGAANLKCSGYEWVRCRATGWFYWRHKSDRGSRLCRVGRRREAERMRGSLTERLQAAF